MNTSLEHKTIVILVADHFDDASVLYPALYWSGLGAKVILSPVTLPQKGDKPITGLHGTTIPLPSLPAGRRYTVVSLRELPMDKIDAVVIPGGYAVDTLRQDKKVQELLADCDDRGRVIGALGLGVQILITVDFSQNTEILKTHKVTAAPSISVEITQAKGRMENEPAMIDNNLVTGRGIEDLPEFCEGVALAIEQARPARR
jgi:protease I